MSDLVSTLRDMRTPLAVSAADEIERLQRDNRAFQEANSHYREHNSKLEAEIERLRSQLVKDDDATRRKIAGAICCQAHKLGCAAQNGSEFSSCQMHTFMRDADHVLEVLLIDEQGK